MNITTKQFQLSEDLPLVWDFLTDIYEKGADNGVTAPFFEYAMNSNWMDKSYTDLDRLWFDGDKVVALVFYEDPVTNIFFNVRRGYEFLVDEMIDYAVEKMPNFDDQQQFVLFGGQECLKKAAEKRGYRQVFEYEDRVFDFENELSYELPKGYRFVDPDKVEILKLAKLCWYGFGHSEIGEFTDWDKEDDSDEWTPAKQYRCFLESAQNLSPHETHDYDIIIEDENGEYVCYSGMWWVPENQLAYMEPLCTHPDHRRKGLAAAALTLHYRRMKALGATHMTGGSDPFYERIGYGKGFHWTFWKKQDDNLKG